MEPPEGSPVDELPGFVVLDGSTIFSLVKCKKIRKGQKDLPPVGKPDEPPDVEPPKGLSLLFPLPLPPLLVGLGELVLIPPEDPPVVKLSSGPPEVCPPLLAPPVLKLPVLEAPVVEPPVLKAPVAELPELKPPELPLNVPVPDGSSLP